MANTKSALKRWRQSLKRRLRNRNTVGSTRTAIKVARDSMATGSDNAAALCFHLEVANGQAVEVIVPYARRSVEEIAFDDPQVSEVQPEIFADLS